MRSGRRIYENLKKAFSYIITVHVPIAGMTILPVFFRLPLMLSPIHIAFLEILIDPSCSLVFEAEPEEEDRMRRPPRPRAERLFRRHNLAFGFLQGLNALAAVFAVFLIVYLRGKEEKEYGPSPFPSWSSPTWRSCWRTDPGKRWYGSYKGGITGSRIGSSPGPCSSWPWSYTSPVEAALRLGPLHPVDLAICLGAGVASVAWFEAFKATRRRRATLGKGAASW